MKKRIISGTLALAMIIALIASISVPASAGVDYNGYYVSSAHLEEGVKYTHGSVGFSDIIKDDGGYIQIDGNTIILNNVTINSIYNGIFIYDVVENAEGSKINGNVTIVLSGKNTINLNGTGGRGIYLYNKTGNNMKNVTIQSDSTNQGTLEINGGNDSQKINAGIEPSNTNLSINNCSVNIVGNNSSGINLSSGNLEISNSTINATGSDIGIMANGGNLDIKNSTVTAAETANSMTAAIQANNGSMNITDSIVNTLETSYYGLGVFNGNITIQGGRVSAKAKSASIGAIGTPSDSKGKIILAPGTTIIKGGEIVTLDNFLIGKDLHTAQTIGNNTTKYTTEITNAGTDVLISSTGTLNIQTQKPEAISNVTLPSDTDLQNAVLTQADRDAMANGTNVNIQMVINSVQAPSDSDKVKQSLGKNTLGMYLDISIIKTVGDAQTTVHNLNSPIRITFTIPENLRGKDKYYVIRVHDGVTTVLEDLDNDPNTVTFETDQFSTYALVYSTPSAKTSDNSNIIAMAVMAFSSLATVAYIERKRN